MEERPKVKKATPGKVTIDADNIIVSGWTFENMTAQEGADYAYNWVQQRLQNDWEDGYDAGVVQGKYLERARIEARIEVLLGSRGPSPYREAVLAIIREEAQNNS